MKGMKPGNTPENWLRCPQAQLLVSQGPHKPSSASLTPGGPMSPLVQLLSQGGPGTWGPHPFLQLFCDSAVFPPPFPYSFLSLAGNQIRQVENLCDLPHLQFLDLSENLIETLKLGRNALALAHGIGPGVPSLLSALLPVLTSAAHPPGGLEGCAKGQWLWTGRWGCKPHPRLFAVCR